MKQNKPIILAICGKSASGKDTLAKQLANDFQNRHISFNYIVSDTTRPPRINEQDTIDYNFISNVSFARNKIQNKYLECSYFRGWYYGTNKDNIELDKINIGVFNIDGIKSLRKYRKHFTIIPIYLEEDIIIRLKRSYNRENRWKTEYFRRAFVDWRDFRNINQILYSFNHYIILEEERTVLIKSNKIFWMLHKWGII